MTPIPSCLWLTLVSLLVSSAMAMPSAKRPEGDFCCLCGSSCGHVERPEEHVNKYGKTCSDLANEVADLYFPEDKECGVQQLLHSQRCCDPDHDPLPIIQVPTAAPVIRDPGPVTGDHPICTLCHDGRFPAKPNTINAILGFDGLYTCEDLVGLGCTFRSSCLYSVSNFASNADIPFTFTVLHGTDRLHFCAIVRSHARSYGKHGLVLHNPSNDTRSTQSHLILYHNETIYLKNRMNLVDAATEMALLGRRHGLPRHDRRQLPYRRLLRPMRFAKTSSSWCGSSIPLTILIEKAP